MLLSKRIPRVSNAHVRTTFNRLTQINSTSLFHTAKIAYQIPVKNSTIAIDDAQAQLKIHRMQKYIDKSKFLTKLSKKPRFKPFFDNLKEAHAIPTVTAFLILHELSAILPLFLFWYMIYEYLKDNKKVDQISDEQTSFIDEMPESYQEKYKKGTQAIKKMVGKYYSGSHEHEMILSGAISYGLVKLLYPVRALLSLYFAPGMGRSMMSLLHMVKR